MNAMEEWDNREDSELLNGARLMHHVAEKGFQAGAVLGCAIVVPIVAYRHRSKVGSLSGAGSKLLSALGKTALVGVGASTILGLARVASIPADERENGLQDRAYRLHYNRGQNRVDLFSEAGMALGGTAAMLMVSPAAAVVLGGAAVGSVAGIFAHIATYAPQAS